MRNICAPKASRKRDFISLGRDCLIENWETSESKETIHQKNVNDITIMQSNPPLERIPAELFHSRNFPNLHELTINSEIKEITTDDLKNATKLNILRLPSNKLRKLARGSFHSKLSMLNVVNNEIESIGDFTFENQNRLTHLYLRKNKLTIIRENTFAGLTELTELHLDGNEIHKIENGAFANLSKLKYLNLDHNKIKMLNDDVFDGLTALETLSIADNQMETIGDSLWTLNSLKTLRLDFNKINDTNIVKFAKLSNLSKLYLRASGICLENVNVDSTLASSSLLKYLDLGANNLTNESSLEVLRIFPNLTEINISGNDFESSTAASQIILRIFPEILFSYHI